MAELEGRIALVTGSSRNLGAAVARAFADSGARVVVTYRSSRAIAEGLIGELPGGGHAVVRFDATTGEPRSMVEETRRAVGSGVDVLVNNFGPFSMVPYLDLDEEEFDLVWNGNVRTAYLLTKLLAPQMRSAGWGRIVNVSAGSAYIRNHSVYSLAKQSIITLTEELALELGPEITVNCVAPGQIAESAGEMERHDPGFADRAAQLSPAGRLVTRAEVAALLVTLCGPIFDMVTGATIPVDGERASVASSGHPRGGLSRVAGTSSVRRRRGAPVRCAAG